MDPDRTVTEFDEYKYTIWGTVQLTIYGRTMDQALERFDALFKDDMGCDVPGPFLNADTYQDIQSAVRGPYGRTVGRVFEREYIFKVLFETSVGMYDDDGEYDEDEVRFQIEDESIIGSCPDFVKDAEVIETELEEIDYVGSGYWD